MFPTRITISKIGAHVLIKKVHEIEKDEMMNPYTRAIFFLLKLLIFWIPYILTKSRMKTLMGQ